MHPSSVSASRGLELLLHRRRVTRGTGGDPPACQKFCHEACGFAGLHWRQAPAPQPVRVATCQCRGVFGLFLHVSGPVIVEEEASAVAATRLTSITLVQFACAEIGHSLAPSVISTVPALWSSDARQRYFPGID